jgi:hypothetical protein
MPEFTQADNTVNGRRLTLVEGEIWPDTPDSGSSFLQWRNHTSDLCALYYDGAWKLYNHTGAGLDLTTAVSGGPVVAGNDYAVFGYWTGSAMAIEITTLVDNLGYQDGVKVKNGDPTRRYLGAFRASASGKSLDIPKARLLYNEYNKLERKLLVRETTPVWTLSGDTPGIWRPANNNANNRVQVMHGGFVRVSLRCVGMSQANVSAIFRRVGIGKNSSTSNHATEHSIATPGDVVFSIAHLEDMFTGPLGAVSYYWVEAVDGPGSSIWIGQNRSELSGFVLM